MVDALDVIPGNCDSGRLPQIGIERRVSKKAPPLIVSLHMPKTAGNSFKVVLEEHFGDAMKSDYADYPMNVSPAVRHRQAVEGCLATAKARADFGDIRCIHGHFLPIKYLLLA